MNDIKAVFLSVVGNLITPLVIFLGGIVFSYYSSFSFESKLIIINTALILSAIIIMLGNQYSPKRARVVQAKTSTHTYLVQKNVAKHIPDAETFNYLGKIYGFHWGDIEIFTEDEFKRRFTTDSVLPSIIPHFQAYILQIQKQNEQKAT